MTAAVPLVKRPALFFDRDGVLNEDLGFVHKPADLRWIPGAKDTIRWLNDAGYLVFVVTNQSGVARGYFGESEVKHLHLWMQAELAVIGAHIDQFTYCPHHPEAVIPAYRQVCTCRKPGPGMILGLMEAWSVDSNLSLLVGDQPRDIEAAAAAGIAAARYSGGNLLDFLKSALLTPKKI